jgi:phosphoserine aminotransferase
LPKIFRIKKSGIIDQSIFSGSTINTPSLLCVADYVAALEWAREIGGLNKLIEIADNNLQIIKDWVSETDWIKFLAKEESTISNTSVCLEFSSKSPNGDEIDTSKLSKTIQNMLEEEEVAFDIGAYRDAPPGLRIWTGATIEPSDISILLEWINWAYFVATEKN